MACLRDPMRMKVITVQNLKKKSLLNEQATNWSAHTDVINVEQLDEQTMGDIELRAEIITLFITQARSSFEIISSSDDIEAIRLAAHTLKGTCRSIGAFGLASLAAEVEHDQHMSVTMLEVELGLVVSRLDELLMAKSLSKHCNLYP